MSIQTAMKKFGSTTILALLKMRVWLLMKWQHVQFPERAIGGDLWIYSWRLNFLSYKNESESLIWCKKLIKPGMVVLDIGAHLGYYTRLTSNLVKESGLVLAFEPCPENSPMLKYNVERLRFNNVRISNNAVSSKSGMAVLFISPGHSNHSLNNGYTEEQGRVEVETIAIDSFLPTLGIKKVDFVKIDVEGAEPLVLEGMRQTVKNSPELVMLVEYNPIALRAGGFTPSALLDTLRTMDMSPMQILPNGDLGEVNLSSDETVNLLCIPLKKMDQFQ